MRDNVNFIADMAPLTGALLAGEDGGRAYNAGDYPGMAMAAAGVIPGGKLIGRIAKKTSPTMATKVVNDVISELPMDEASRMARAKEMGFFTDMPILYSTAPEGETIKSAAIRVGDGVFEGSTHFNAMINASDKLGIDTDEVANRLISQPEYTGGLAGGFITTGGRYVERPDAGWIAERTGTGKVTSPQGLVSETVRMGGELPSSAVRTGATAPGLPGGQGAWGVQMPPKPHAGAGFPPQADASIPLNTTEALWHRASRPVPVDVRGAEQFEIESTLADLWKNGYDSALLRNYIRPGGKTPENVVVVRDLSQLRSPLARFDLAKRLSSDLLAGLGGVGVAGLLGLLMNQNARADRQEQ